MSEIANNYRIVPTGTEHFEIQEPYQVTTWHGLWAITEWRRSETEFQYRFASVEKALEALFELRKEQSELDEVRAIEAFRKATIEPVYFHMRPYK